MTGHVHSSVSARHMAWAAAFLAATSALTVLFLAARIAWGSQAMPAYEDMYQVALQVGAGSRQYDLPVGTSITLPISVTVAGPQPLGAASVLVQYNPAVIRPTQCVPRPAAPSGYCNTAFDPENGLIRFNLLSESGVMGEAGLFDLTFTAASGAALGAESGVTPLIESLADIHGNYMTSGAVGSNIRVVAAAGAGPVVYVGAVEATTPFHVSHGTTVTVPIWITPVTGLASGSFALSFDPAIALPLACHPIAAGTGDASGLCALHAGQVRASLLSVAGLSGPVLAFEVIFTAAGGAAAGATSYLKIDVETLTDIRGAPITADIRNNSLVIDAGTGPGAVLSIAPATQNLYDNAQATVHVFLNSGTQVHAATWAIHYDPAVLQAESCQLTPGFTSAICNATGTPGAVRMSLLSVDPLPASVDVATIVFRRHPEAHGGQWSALTFEVTNFADLDGNALTYRPEGAKISIKDELGSTPAVVLSLAGAPTGGFLLARGASLDLPIRIAINSQLPVATLTGNLRYNPAIIRATRCIWGAPDIADPPLVHCNAQYDPQAGLIRFNLLSTSGVTGTLTPFTITVEAASGASDGQTSNLDLSLETVTGPQGESRVWLGNDTKVHLAPPVVAPLVRIGSPDLQGTARYTVTLGSSLTAPLWLEGVTGLGAGTVEVRYDPTVAAAIRCTVRTDLVPALDGGFCALSGTSARIAFVSSQGLDGAVHLCDIVFAQATNVVGGETTALSVTVENFVDTQEIPVPTTVRAGQFNICPLMTSTTDLRIARSGANLRLNWTPVANAAHYYQVWRSETAPYFAFGDSTATVIRELLAPTASTSLEFLDAGAWTSGANYYYMVRALCTPDYGAPDSNRVGKFVFPLVPGSN